MSWQINPQTKFLAVAVAVMAGLGAVFGAVVGAGMLRPSLAGAMLGSINGAVDFAALTLLIGAAENLLPRTRAGLVLDRAPFLAVFGIKAAAYSAVILAVVGGRLGTRVALLFADPELIQAVNLRIDTLLPLGVLLPTTFLVTCFLLLLHQLRVLVGTRTLRNIVLGRYHRARMEDRFFLFVDIVGSTTLAERLGPVATNRFLDRVFQLASDPVDRCHGEIYQYVGDEMVITWTVPEGRVTARPLACFFAIEAVLGQGAAEFTREFGVAPRLRAALHAGTVIAGEVGGSRRAIVFHGDVMNTASRIENATRDLNRSFLASAAALSRLDDRDNYKLDDLGSQQLRGREGQVRLFAVALPKPAS